MWCVLAAARQTADRAGGAVGAMIAGRAAPAALLLLLIVLAPGAALGKCPEGLLGADCSTCSSDKGCDALLNTQGEGCATGALYAAQLSDRGRGF